jgi:protoporphyrin/coproporphyrin ferrochelatase
MTGPRPVHVMLMAMGGPDSLENIEAYLLDVRGGRPTAPELVEEIRERYRATGGKSPVLDIMRSVQAKLEAARPGVRVVVGMRHWRPRIADVWVDEVAADPPSEVVAICMAPHDSEMTVGKYLGLLDEGRSRAGGDIPVRRVRSWATHPKLVEALARTVLAGLEAFPADERPSVPLLFTAHSLPERVLASGDPYPGEVASTVAEVAARLADLEGSERPHRFAFQSQGRSAEPWLGPTVEEALTALAEEGRRTVLVAPVGFLSDHVEVTYDIDVEFKALAAKLGLHLERTPMLNDSDALVDVLAALVDEQLART